MLSYKNILVAVELNPKSDIHLLRKANDIKAQFSGQMTLLHVVENMANYGAAYGIVVGVDIEQTLRDEASKTMARLGEKLGVPAAKQLVRMGSPGHVILEEAEAQNADLILVGSHGRHGVRLLLGSTANSVLHGAKCDVLAVRLQDE